MARILGADLVGMSTVPEVILAPLLRPALRRRLGRHQLRRRPVRRRSEPRGDAGLRAASAADQLPSGSCARSSAAWRDRGMTCCPQEIIRAKRDGRSARATTEIADFIAGLTDGTVTEGQVAAFAMAVFFRGMDARRARRADAGDDALRREPRLARRDLPGPMLDKHSTGGVGDNVSLMLAPMLAACGAYVPMISGRGLGHTGGTLDKLDSIPGYVDAARPRAVPPRRREAGCAIIGQTADLAPADRRLYAIRDVTATVESIALITASILSKKLAAGLQGAGHGREDRLRRLHADARRRARTRREHRHGRQRRRPADGLADHRHERAARQRRRQCGRGRERRRLS